jgi:hypothetical protein
MAIAGITEAEEEALRRWIRYLVWARRTRFFGKITLSLQAGEIKQAEEFATRKPDELPG